MLERTNHPIAPETKDRKLILQNRLVAPLVAHIVNHFMGRDLTTEEQVKIKELVNKIVKGERIKAYEEIPQVYESQKSKLICDGEENVPTSGATIVIGNHMRGGPLYDMGQYFEIARSVHDQRTSVEDEFVREPFVIMQKGIIYAVKVFGGRLKVPIPWSGFFTGQFYELGARSFGWEVVLPPKFDQNDQVTNSQRLPTRAITRLEAGGAMIWYPQGKHRYDLLFPQKAGDFLFRLRDKDIQMVPLRVIRQSQDILYLRLGKPVHVQDLPKLMAQ